MPFQFITRWVKTILLLGVIYLPASAQTPPTHIKPDYALTLYAGANAIAIDSFSQLPAFIQERANTILQKAFTDFVPNITFKMGQLLNLDTLFANTSMEKYEFRNKAVIPKYQLLFSLQDTSLFCCWYLFEMSFDAYGQLTFLEWPRASFNIRKDFKPLDQVLQKALSTAKAQQLKTDQYNIDFKYNNELDMMFWEFCFLQSALDSKNSSHREFKCVLVHPINLAIVSTIGRSESSISCGSLFNQLSDD